MRDREDYLQEVRNRLFKMFRASKDGYKASVTEKHRLEGFMQAGTYFGVASGEELRSIMDEVHNEVFSMSIAERRGSLSSTWTHEDIDYSQYEPPSYGRNR